jgi:hypothetical protein
MGLEWGHYATPPFFPRPLGDVRCREKHDVIESFQSGVHPGLLKGDKPKDALIPRLRNDDSCHFRASVNRADFPLE